jgi:hypothetical protein
MDAGAVRGTGGLMGAAWSVAEVEGTARGIAEVDEVGDEAVVWGGRSDSPGWQSDRLRWQLDHQPLY